MKAKKLNSSYAVFVPGKTFVTDESGVIQSVSEGNNPPDIKVRTKRKVKKGTSAPTNLPMVERVRKVRGRRLNYERLVQCEDCGRWLLPENLGRHRSKYHPGESVKLFSSRQKPTSAGTGYSSQSNEPPLVGKGQVLCPVCRLPVLTTHLPKHLRKIHGQKAAPVLPSGDYVSCDLCGSPVRSKNLPKHMAKVHPGRMSSDRESKAQPEEVVSSQDQRAKLPEEVSKQQQPPTVSRQETVSTREARSSFIETAENEQSTNCPLCNQTPPPHRFYAHLVQYHFGVMVARYGEGWAISSDLANVFMDIFSIIECPVCKDLINHKYYYDHVQKKHDGKL